MNLSFNSKGKYISSRSLYKNPTPASKSSLDRASVLTSLTPQKDLRYKRQEPIKFKPKLKPSSQSKTFIKNLLLPSTPPTSQFPSFRFYNHQVTSGSIWSINYNKIRNSYLTPKSHPTYPTHALNKSCKSCKSHKSHKSGKPGRPAEPGSPLNPITASDPASHPSPLSPQVPRVEIKYKSARAEAAKPLAVPKRAPD